MGCTASVHKKSSGGVADSSEVVDSADVSMTDSGYSLSVTQSSQRSSNRNAMPPTSFTLNLPDSRDGSELSYGARGVDNPLAVIPGDRTPTSAASDGAQDRLRRHALGEEHTHPIVPQLHTSATSTPNTTITQDQVGPEEENGSSMFMLPPSAVEVSSETSASRTLSIATTVVTVKSTDGALHQITEEEWSLLQGLGRRDTPAEHCAEPQNPTWWKSAYEEQRKILELRARLGELRSLTRVVSPGGQQTRDEDAAPQAESIVMPSPKLVASVSEWKSGIEQPPDRKKRRRPSQRQSIRVV